MVLPAAHMPAGPHRVARLLSGLVCTRSGDGAGQARDDMKTRDATASPVLEIMFFLFY